MEPLLTVEHVRASVNRHNIEIQELPADTSTAMLAAAALNTSVGSIVKSLLFMADETPVLALVSGDREADLNRISILVGAERTRLAKPREVLHHAGFAVGGVPPVGHRSSLRVLMDRNLLLYPVVYAAAGSPHAIFPIAPDRLPEVANAEIADLTK